MSQVFSKVVNNEISSIDVRKYHLEDYINIYESHKNFGLDLVFIEISQEWKSETSFEVISWLLSDNDLREIFKYVRDAAKFEVVNEEIKVYNSKLVNEALENIED